MDFLTMTTTINQAGFAYTFNTLSLPKVKHLFSILTGTADSILAYWELVFIL
ncbi:hypothetical protein ADICYQ_0681 [Cyclobacterium qasimii M12-11B]|uniref:Uncharacterized protein n=1 Tax=Cyclobacterium qasimii M12-11B TaxID=641524 RepID=S7VLK9_9BACT|nr:hypothetical protein ADICYQ_0681 [Cyclobacterium qasimii M12-11B]